MLVEFCVLVNIESKIKDKTFQNINMDNYVRVFSLQS